jgi:hypothetical protein|tara:strand:+ start:15978 stop:16232 length:255 start_codon:yes stop_codon:yes gene_type:complete
MRKGQLIEAIEMQIKMVEQVCDYLNDILEGDYLVAADVMDAIAYNDLRLDFTKIITFDKADISLSALAYMATVNPAWFDDAKTR